MTRFLVEMLICAGVEALLGPTPAGTKVKTGSVGETYGFGGTATEVGVGDGASAGVSANNSWKLPWGLPGW